MSDFGFIHVAVEINDIDKSISFYKKYTGMEVVHRRTDPTTQVDVAWISDLTRQYLILINIPYFVINVRRISNDYVTRKILKSSQF